MTSHHLDLRDRGVEHCHRWWPHCSCGWIGVCRRRKKEAVALYRAHLPNVRRGTAKPRECTPPADLPEQLR